MSNRRAGTIFVKSDSTQYDAKGNFSYNIGIPKRETILGADQPGHGYKETQQPSFIEGEITDASSLDLKTLLTQDGVTVTLELANGKTVVLRNAYYAADGNVGTAEGNVQVRWESSQEGEEIAA